MNEKMNEKMSEERKMILNMLKEGKIDVEEAERLIEALEEGPKILENKKTKEANKKTTARKIRVLCVEDGKNKVNVKLPLSIIQIAFGIVKRFIPKENEHYEQVQNIDLDEIFLIIEEENTIFPYKFIDIDDEESGTKVELYIE